MAMVELNRVVMLKTIYSPTNDPMTGQPVASIDIPVIVQITFKDSGTGQIYTRTFNNTASNETRTVNVVHIESQSFEGDPDGTNYSDVEEMSQGTVQNFDQKEFLNPLLGGGVPGAHLVSHVLRYGTDRINPNSDAGKAGSPDPPWIDIEVIDVMQVKGFMKQRNYDSTQVTNLVLQNDPGNGGSGQSLGTGDPTKFGILTPGSGPGDENTDYFFDPNDPLNPAITDSSVWNANLPSALGLSFDGSFGNLPAYNDDGMGDDFLPEDTNGRNDIPVRLDPFQNIVNVDWGKPVVLGWAVSKTITIYTGQVLFGYHYRSMTEYTWQRGNPFPLPPASCTPDGFGFAVEFVLYDAIEWPENTPLPPNSSSDFYRNPRVKCSSFQL